MFRKLSTQVGLRHAALLGATARQQQQLRFQGNYRHGTVEPTASTVKTSSEPSPTQTTAAPRGSSSLHSTRGVPTPSAAAASGAPNVHKEQRYEGVLTLTAQNVSTELKSKVPTLLYFHVTNHPEVGEYTKNLSEQITLANRNNRMQARNYEATGEDRDLSVRLATIDCLKEQALAQQFGIDPNQFPLVLFLYNQQIIDRLVGIIPESQIKDAVTAFMAYAQGEVANKKEGKGPGGIEKVNRMDNDDENILTLIQTAQKKLKDKDFIKGEALYQKAIDIGREKVQEAKVRLSLDKKKMTPELFDKLKADPHYFALAQALAGMGMCHCAQKRFEEAKVIVDELRNDFPTAIKELRDVAEAVVRIELLFLTNFDLEKDNYVSLMKREELLNDPVEFYLTNVKLAAAHVFEKRHASGIDECLRLIRTEPKLLPALKKAGVVPEDASLGQKDATPARKVLFLIFEALGNNNEHVVAARKKLSAYLSL